MNKLKGCFFKFIDSSPFIYLFVNLALGYLLYILLGVKIELDSALTLSLAISGGAWYYLALEQNKAKEARNGYVSQLRELEDSSFSYLESSVPFLNYLISYSQVKDKSGFLKGEVNYSTDEAVKQWLLLEAKYTKYVYNKLKFENSKLSFFKDLGEVDESLNGVRREINVIMNNVSSGEPFKVKIVSGVNFSNLREEALNEMSNVFTSLENGFEDLSESYYLVKRLCLSLVASGVVMVMLKAVLESCVQ